MNSGGDGVMNTITTAGSCILVGVPVQEGTGRLGCDMGPGAYRAAGLEGELAALGLQVADRGNLVPSRGLTPQHPNAVIVNLPEVVAWIQILDNIAYMASDKAIPIFLGGDHSLSAGTVPGMSRRAAEEGRELFVLWLDAHADFHTLETTESGHLHGVSVAYASGQSGFEGYFPPLAVPVKPENICLAGLRSVDRAERMALRGTGVRIHDMRSIDAVGIAPLMRSFLKDVASVGGLLHVSLDVDFLDPSIAPGVGTAVPGGATFREAHLLMEMLHDSGLVRSVDLVELNPFLDDRGRTARLMVDLAASLMGKQFLH